MFEKCRAEKKSDPFEISSFFVNRLLNVYFRKTENREYVRLLFYRPMGRLFEYSNISLNSMSFSPQKEPAPKRNTVCMLASGKILGLDEEEDPVQQDQRDSDHGTRSNQSVVSTTKSSQETPSPTHVFEKGEDEKTSEIAPDEVIVGMRLGELLKITDEMIESINRQISCMPLEIRFLCKLIATHAIKFVQLRVHNPHASSPRSRGRSQRPQRGN